MEEYYFETPLTNSKVLCIGSITKAEAAAARYDAHFCDGFGYYLFVADDQEPRREIEVVAKLVSEEAAASLAHLLRYGKARFAAELA